MNWQVSASISGGRRFSAAEYQEYLTTAQALGRESATLRTIGKSLGLLNVQRVMGPLAASLPTSHTGTGCSAPDHFEFPLDQIVERCSAHARILNGMADELAELSVLIIRAQSLYSQADDSSRRTMRNLLQTLFIARPLESAIGLGLTAGYGWISGSVKDGKINHIHASDALSPAHEAVLGAAGTLLSGMSPFKGLLREDEVNRAATRLSEYTEPRKNRIQGNRLTVTEVKAKADVVGESHSVTESMEDLRRLAEERLGKIDIGSGLDYATVAISKYRRPDGSYSWLVTIPGTDGEDDSPFGWSQNIDLMSTDPQQRMRADSARMVHKAMQEAGIGSDEPVALIGHSQGGIVAATLASDLQDEYDIEHVVTAGSPIANHPIPEKTWVTSIEMEDEIVAAADGAANPDLDNRLTVRGTVERTSEAAKRIFGGTKVANAPREKEITHWIEYHQAAYQNATDLGSHAVGEHERHFQSVIDGELEEVTYWQGRMSH